MHYRARDLLLLPGLLSLSRLPLAIAFPFVVERPLVALMVLVSAGLTDVLDGWLARRYGQVTATGAALNPVTDKFFVLTVGVTLIVSGHLSFRGVLLLSTREIRRVASRYLVCSEPSRAWIARRASRRERPGQDCDAATVRHGRMGSRPSAAPRVLDWGHGDGGRFRGALLLEARAQNLGTHRDRSWS